MLRGVSPLPLLQSVTESKNLKTPEELSIAGEDRSDGNIHPQDLNRLHTPKPPNSHQKPKLTAQVSKTQPAGTASHPVNMDPVSQSLDYTGPEGIRFDEQGMVLPHSILGSLEDFRRYLEAKGEVELVKRIPKSQIDPTSKGPWRHHSKAVESGILSSHRNIQSNALQHWHTHMSQSRQQQDFLSDVLDRPVEHLLMSQTDHFRETQEQRELLSQVMPLVQSGYGHRVGSEFWSLPQHYGDEVSGITATLTQTEQGRREPITYVGQPSCIRQESGIIGTETQRPSSHTLVQSAYLQQQCQELSEVLKDMDLKKPDINELEVIGSNKPVTFVTANHSPLLEEEDEEHQEKKKENLDPLVQYEDVVTDPLFLPALRFCGQLATWTGNSTTNQGEVGVSSTIIFEAPTGETASSHLELHNEGSTAIFYSWQQLPVPHSFSNLLSQTKGLYFYFNSCSGVILPGDTQQVEFIFKAEEPGIRTELWQLNTHPVLLQGASLQVKLKGVALHQDKTADQRLFIETKLEKIVTVAMCQSIVCNVLKGVHTPEKPSSPAELYETEEEQFVRKNTKLQYFSQPVGGLKRLWQELNPGRTWDLSVDTLRQVVVSLPRQESAQETVPREKALIQLNSLLLQLSGPSEMRHHYLTPATIGQQLWRELLDTMAHEATRLRNLLGLPAKVTWLDEKDEFPPSDVGLAEDVKDEKSDVKGGAAAKEEQAVAKSRFKNDNKGESKSAVTEKAVEESRKKGKKKDDTGKGKAKEKQGRESVSLTETHPEIIHQQRPEDQTAGPAVMNTYTGLLHKKVYALMEDIVDNLCALMDERTDHLCHR